MGHRLDKGEAEFGWCYLALEQRQEALRGGAGGGEVVVQPGEGRDVVVDHLGQPEGQAGEGQLVAGQDQLIGAGVGLKGATTVQPIGNGIGVRFGGVDADVGGNAGEQLIAAKDDAVI